MMNSLSLQNQSYIQRDQTYVVRKIIDVYPMGFFYIPFSCIEPMSGLGFKVVQFCRFQVPRCKRFHIWDRWVRFDITLYLLFILQVGNETC